MGNVGDKDGGGGFADVPVQVNKGAIAGGEIIVAVEDCGQDLEEKRKEKGESVRELVERKEWKGREKRGTYDEKTKTEDSTEDDFAF